MVIDMKNNVSCDLEDMLSVFDTSVSAVDIIAAKALAGVSAEIVKHRINLGMTQKQFAEYMEVSQGMVSKWESADYNFSVKSLAHIAAKLDLDVVVCFKDVMKSKRDEKSAKSKIVSIQCAGRKGNSVGKIHELLDASE